MFIKQFPENPLETLLTDYKTYNKSWNVKNLNSNNALTARIISLRPDFVWDMAAVAKLPLIGIEEVPGCSLEEYANEYSANPNIRIDHVMAHRDYSWDFNILVKNPGISFTDIMATRDILPWENCVSIAANPSVTLGIIKAYDNVFDWDGKYLSSNPNVTPDFVAAHRHHYQWDPHNLVHNQDFELTIDFVRHHIKDYACTDPYVTHRIRNVSLRKMLETLDFFVPSAFAGNSSVTIETINDPVWKHAFFAKYAGGGSRRYADRFFWDWNAFAANPNISYSDMSLRRPDLFDNYTAISCNRGLTSNDILSDSFQAWDWDVLSSNDFGYMKTYSNIASHNTRVHASARTIQHGCESWLWKPPHGIHVRLGWNAVDTILDDYMNKD